MRHIEASSDTPMSCAVRESGLSCGYVELRRCKLQLDRHGHATDRPPNSIRPGRKGSYFAAKYLIELVVGASTNRRLQIHLWLDAE